jgi:hypothetical protein
MRGATLRNKPPASSEKKKKGIPPRDKIIKAVLDEGVTFWRDADGDGYATVPSAGRIERYRVRSTAFRNVVRRIYGDAFPSKFGTPGAISDTAWREARASFEAMGFRGEVRSPDVRLCQTEDGTIWIDLGDPSWQLARVDAKGWRIVKSADVPLIRPDGVRALPEPTPGDATLLERLYQLMNLTAKAHRILAMSWCVAALYPSGPYPVGAVDGEDGSGKTTCNKMLRALTDPNKAPLRAKPRNEEDLVIAARNGRVAGFDNVSTLSEEMADGICRLSTGAGLGKRKLYTDDEEQLFSGARPVLLNGIPSLLSRGDVASRALPITLRTISKDKRRAEVEIWHEFNELRPSVFGLLLTALAKALERLPSLKLPVLPRMADFARLACAAAPAFGWTVDEVLATIMESRIAGTRAVLEGDRVAEIVAQLVSKEDWKGTATQLLAALTDLAPEQVRREKTWPKDAARLSGRLRRLATALRSVGIIIDLDREGHNRIRQIEIKRTRADKDNKASAASAASAGQESEDQTKAYEGRGADADADAEVHTDRPQTSASTQEPNGADADADAQHHPERPPESPEKGRLQREDAADVNSPLYDRARGPWGHELDTRNPVFEVDYGGVADRKPQPADAGGDKADVGWI